MITPSFSLTATERVLPKLALDFTTASLDPRVTITRTTGASNPATYVNGNGIVTAATDNQPRFDYDPLTGICKGLLIEESRTNDLFPSGAINSGWSAQAATIGATPTTAPDGTDTAYPLVENTASAEHRLLAPSMAWVNGTTYSISFFAKANGRTSFRLLDGNITGNFLATFDLTAKTAVIVSSTGNNSCSISEYKDGWFLCRYTQTSALASAGSAYFFRIVLRNASNATTYTGDGVSGIYVWGGQREIGAFATSYIPTTTTSLTRNADVVSMTGTNFSDWYNQSEGAFFIKQSLIGASGNQSGLTVLGTAYNNNAFHYMASYNSTRRPFWLGYTGTTNDVSLYLLDAVALETQYGVCFTYKQDNFAAAKIGETPRTDTSGGVYTSMSQLLIGYGQQYLNGHIQQIKYWPHRLTDNEVQAFSKG